MVVTVRKGLQQLIVEQAHPLEVNHKSVERREEYRGQNDARRGRATEDHGGEGDEAKTAADSDAESSIRSLSVSP